MSRKNSGTCVMRQNALKQWDCRILRSAISQEENDESTWFLACR